MMAVPRVTLDDNSSIIGAVTVHVSIPTLLGLTRHALAAKDLSCFVVDDNNNAKLKCLLTNSERTIDPSNSSRSQVSCSIVDLLSKGKAI